MDILRLKGTPRQVGRQYGEAYREGFRAFFEEAVQSASQHTHWYGELALFGATMREHFPRFYEELLGMAEGSALSLEDILLGHRNMLAAETCCTNIAFTGASGGPIFGKNLDLAPNPKWPYIVRHVQYEDGQEIIHTVIIGELTSRDTCMNGHGLTIGGSSVGSVFQKSLQNPSIEAGLYAMLCACTTVEGAVRFLQRYLYIGKGYNFVLADDQGQAVVLECACPLLQVRRAAEGQDAIFCTNTYKLPSLLNADLRPALGKLYSEKRFHYLERQLWQERVPRTVEQMKTLLASYGPDGGLCRPIDSGDPSVTRMSVIARPAQREFYVADGRPCDAPFVRML